MSRPPVFFTVAAIHIEPLLNLKEFMPSFQDTVRKEGFAGDFRSDSIKRARIVVGSSNPSIEDTSIADEVLCRVFTPDKSASFGCSSEGIFSLSTSDYTSRGDLLSKFEMGLAAFEGAVGGINTLRRVGVRMLDLLRPSDRGEESQLDDFLASPSLELVSPDEGDWHPGNRSVAHELSNGDNDLIVRIDAFPGGMVIPSDLHEPLMAHKLRDDLGSKPGHLHAIIDIDGSRSFEPAISYSREVVLAELARNKRNIGDMFWKCTTVEAQTFWGIKRSERT